MATTDMTNETSKQEPTEGMIAFLAQYGRHILFALIAAAFVITIAYNLLFRNSVDSESAYLYAQVDYNNFVAHDTDYQKYLLKLQDVLKDYKNLHSKYDPLIAQQLIYLENTELALPYAEETLKQTQNELHSDYGTYAENTLNLAKDEKQLALTQASNLKQNLDKENAALSSTKRALYAFTLLRIAILKDQISKPYEAQEAWVELDTYLHTEQGKNIAIELKDIFNEGNVTLQDYITERKLATK